MSAPLGFADIAGKKNQLIRKALTGSAFLAPYSAAPITSLTTGVAAVSGTLTSASIVGATTVSSSVSFPAGSSVTIGTGTNAETVATSGTPTGTGPYTVTVAALAKAHTSGSSIATAGTLGLAALPTGYQDVGWATDDGINLAEAITTSDVSSWGSVEPTRSDITKQTTTAKVVLQETKALTVGLYTSVDPTTIHPDGTTGEVSIPIPLVPSARYWRMLCLAVDRTDAGEIYVARFLPRVKLSDKDDQKFANDDDPTDWGVTMTAYSDSVLGYSSRYIFGGPGWKALSSDHGFI